jgi:hypothetical protein
MSSWSTNKISIVTITTEDDDQNQSTRDEGKPIKERKDRCEI